jgi:hypothetical protein
MRHSLNPSTPPEFVKEKYLELLQEKDLGHALTELAKDIAKWEFLAFESPMGFQPKIIEEIEKARTFSRSLWNTASQ